MNRAFAIALSTVWLAPAQTAPEFEAASVKVSQPEVVNAEGRRGFRPHYNGGPGTSDPGRIDYQAIPLKALILRAYNLKSYQLEGPDWLAAERFDIVATLPPGTTKEQFSLMLQKLLADRFQMAVHRETREMPIYALIAARNGPKLKESAADVPGATDPRPAGAWMAMGQVGGHKATMASLVDALSGQLDRPVRDMTGLSGKYDFSLKFDPQDLMQSSTELPGTGKTAPDAPVESSLFTVIQNELGLKLDPRKGPVEILVVDRASREPIAN